MPLNLRVGLSGGSAATLNISALGSVSRPQGHHELIANVRVYPFCALRFAQYAFIRFEMAFLSAALHVGRFCLAFVLG